ncbi:MAG: hypothetical protein KDD44_11525 [Bdellovibrionales bacterium]|nr:hypothetical protein [Bdellovibrionales bacterium]
MLEALLVLMLQSPAEPLSLSYALCSPKAIVTQAHERGHPGRPSRHDEFAVLTREIRVAHRRTAVDEVSRDDLGAKGPTRVRAENSTLHPELCWIAGLSGFA